MNAEEQIQQLYNKRSKESGYKFIRVGDMVRLRENHLHYGLVIEAGDLSPVAYVLWFISGEIGYHSWHLLEAVCESR